VTSALIGDRLGAPPLAWSGPRADLPAALAALVREGDVVLTMGAGDITRVGPALLARLASPGASDAPGIAVAGEAGPGAWPAR
jgi:UDP-N-acetylmuramate--alanine ligase